jgi:hypothetical protein
VSGDLISSFLQEEIIIKPKIKKRVFFNVFIKEGNRINFKYNRYRRIKQIDQK